MNERFTAGHQVSVTLGGQDSQAFRNVRAQLLTTIWFWRACVPAPSWTSLTSSSRSPFDPWPRVRARASVAAVTDVTLGVACFVSGALERSGFPTRQPPPLSCAQPSRHRRPNSLHWPVTKSASSLSVVVCIWLVSKALTALSYSLQSLVTIFGVVVYILTSHHLRCRSLHLVYILTSHHLRYRSPYFDQSPSSVSYILTNRHLRCKVYILTSHHLRCRTLYFD